MKLHNILISGLGAMTLVACNDFLEVDAPSKYTTGLIYSSESDISTALNGVYAKALSGETFGGRLYNDHMLNSDVDFASNKNEKANNNVPRRFDLNANSGNAEKLWNSLYTGIESANEFIYNLSNSALYEEGTTSQIQSTEGAVTTIDVPAVTNLTQMMGEAKMLRAMFYHELLSYYGDVPFSFKATFETDNLLPDVLNRQAISDSLIADLSHAAEYMYSQNSGKFTIEHASQEAVYAMIARLALQAGGYSLNHDANDVKTYKMTRPANYKEYYTIARDYTKKLIDRGNHKLGLNYRDVFINECNYVLTKDDDAIFELPFAKEANGNFGYAQGPASDIDTEDETDYSHTNWGITNGGVRTTAFYRLQFNEQDLRRDYVCGTFYFSQQGLPTPRFDYAMHNNKWSKLWSNAGFAKSSKENTGINFAYIRYADVLLMFAEAENELNDGPTAAAKDAVNQVRERAFRGTAFDYVADTDTKASKEDFLKLVLDERKFEFAGENMRWKDLVRNNMYGETLVLTYLAYLSAAEDQAGSAPYMDLVEEKFGINYQKFPTTIYSTPVINLANDTILGNENPNFPNAGVYMLYVLNPYSNQSSPSTTPDKMAEVTSIVTPVAEKTVTGLESSNKNIAWKTTDVAWQSDGTPKAEIYFSLFGYVRGNSDTGNNEIVTEDGTSTILDKYVSVSGFNKELPAVRYIYPYPKEVIARSAGKYTNHYGY